MKAAVITIEKKKYRLIPEYEYQAIKDDIADLKKVLQRRNEKGMEATAFFARLKKK